MRNANKSFEKLRIARRGWSELDRHYVEYLHLKGLTPSEIAPRLDRSPAAIRCFLATLRCDPDWEAEAHRREAEGVVMRFWTPAKVDILKEQWAAGTSVRDIAGMLRTTRNTIIGKAHRLKLPMHARSLLHPDAPRKPRVKKPKGERRARIRTRPPAQGAPLPPPPPPPPPVARDALRIAFADLEPQHCRYSVSAEAPHVFCGHARQGKSAFCAFHHALCTEKPRPEPRANLKRISAHFYPRAA